VSAAEDTANITRDNVKRIAQLEEAALHQRTLSDRVGDRVSRHAGSGKFVVLHIVWFLTWLAINTGLFSGIRPFDPYPFTFLTMIVSLEAIFLSIFLLISQNRMTRQADRRAHLDLQIDLLAEQEMTMMLKMLRRLCEKAGVPAEDGGDEIKVLLQKTDPQQLMKDLQECLPDK
jgi:uncharacterized membrane protein